VSEVKFDVLVLMSVCRCDVYVHLYINTYTSIHSAVLQNVCAINSSKMVRF